LGGFHDGVPPQALKTDAVRMAISGILALE
jgi:hypothetical protein